jgi:hypothetical protein
MKNISRIILLNSSLIFALMGCKDQVSSNKTNPTIQPVSECVSLDDSDPLMSDDLGVLSDGSKLSSPTVSWEQAIDNCELSHYEISIGSAVGTQDILAYTNIGEEVSFSQKFLNLDYSKDYFYSVRAVDRAGNKSTPKTSAAWQIFTPKSLTNLVLWLDAADTSSLKDNEGDSPGDISFSDDVKVWLDLSNSSAVHDFEAVGLVTPSWDVTEKAVRFNGSQQFMATVDHPDINTNTIAQRSLVAVIKTDDDINSRQVVYEEGGTVRGLNIYIEAGKLRCGFWNVTDDGDSAQPYIESEYTVFENRTYIIAYVLDYSHYTGRDSADGTVECFVNGTSTGQVSTTSRLHPHSGDIGLGAMNDGSFFPIDGATTGDQYYFKGLISEFLIYNSAHSADSLDKLYRILSNKWN